LAALRALGVDVKAVEMRDAAGLRTAMGGSRCIVSALNGLAPVMIDTQQNLLDAAVAEGVARCIHSSWISPARTMSRRLPRLQRWTTQRLAFFVLPGIPYRRLISPAS